MLWFCYKHWILMLFFFISSGLNRFLIIYLNLWHYLIFINFWNILWTDWLHNILIGWNVIFSIFFNLFHAYWIPLLLVLFYFLFNWAFNLKLYFFISCWWIILSIIIFGFYFETMFVQNLNCVNVWISIRIRINLIIIFYIYCILWLLLKWRSLIQKTFIFYFVYIYFW